MVVMTEAEVKELPKAIVWRLVKGKLAWVVAAGIGKREGWTPWLPTPKASTSSSTTSPSLSRISEVASSLSCWSSYGERWGRTGDSATFIRHVKDATT